MKHLEIKNSIAGAKGKGGGSKPKPPVLKPPQIGDYSVAASFSYSESVDLISDGPIEGLVNSNGYVLTPEAYMQGVYLNDTQVELTNENFVERYDEAIEEFPVIENGAIECLSEKIKQAYTFLDDYEDTLYNFTSYKFQGYKRCTSYYRGGRMRGSSRGGCRNYAYEVQKRTYQNPIKQKSNKVLVSQFPNPTLFNEGGSRNDIAESQNACIDISSDDGYSGQIIRYVSNTANSLDKGREIYAETTLSQKYSKISSSSNWTDWDYRVYRYGINNARSYYGVYSKRDKLKSKKIACGGTAFFSKTCQNELAEDTLYSEICLSYSNWTRSLGMAGGALFAPQNADLMAVLTAIGTAHEVDAAAVAVAWLLAHPANIIPVLGTNNLDRLARLSDAMKLTLGREDWFEIYTAALGHEVP